MRHPDFSTSDEDDDDVMGSPVNIYIYDEYWRYYLGPSCSKLTTWLVNVALKFQMLISEIRHYFFVEKNVRSFCIALHCKSFSHFFSTKSVSIFGYEVVKQKNIFFEFANSVDSDEGAPDEPPHQDLLCLPLMFEFSK